MNDKDIRRVEDNSNAEYRSADINAALAIGSIGAVKALVDMAPSVKDGYKKLKDKKK
jgi:hypothetical protein